jgi:hypothetical protein
MAGLCLVSLLTDCQSAPRENAEQAFEAPAAASFPARREPNVRAEFLDVAIRALSKSIQDLDERGEIDQAKQARAKLAELKEQADGAREGPSR